VDKDSTPKLADFGLASIIYNTPTAASTITDVVGGTVRYMSPELHQACLDVACTSRPTIQSDVYAFAITLWEVRR
jgi:serine/threonine protein kinase